MALVNVHIHHHGVDANTNTLKLDKIMGQLDDLIAESAGLKEQVTTLQASVDAEQAQIKALLDTNAAVVTGLNNQIAALEAQLASAVDPTALQVVIDELKATRESIATTKSDIEATVPDAPPSETP